MKSSYILIIGRAVFGSAAVIALITALFAMPAVTGHPLSDPGPGLATALMFTGLFLLTFVKRAF